MPDMDDKAHEYLQTLETLARRFETLQEWEYLTMTEKLKKDLSKLIEKDESPT